MLLRVWLAFGSGFACVNASALLSVCLCVRGLRPLLAGSLCLFFFSCVCVLSLLPVCRCVCGLALSPLRGPAFSSLVLVCRFVCLSGVCRSPSLLRLPVPPWLAVGCWFVVGSVFGALVASIGCLAGLLDLLAVE